MLLRVSWWLRRWCPLMEDCIPAWLSAPLVMHPETLPYTVRIFVYLSNKIAEVFLFFKSWVTFMHKVNSTISNCLLLFLIVCFSVSPSLLWLTAQPDVPHYMTVSPGPRSVLFSLKGLPISGGTPITSFVMQWRQNASEQWKETTVPVAGKALVSVAHYSVHYDCPKWIYQ